MREPNYDDGYNDGYRAALLFALQAIKWYGNRAERMLAVELNKKGVKK